MYSKNYNILSFLYLVIDDKNIISNLLIQSNINRYTNVSFPEILPSQYGAIITMARIYSIVVKPNNLMSKPQTFKIPLFFRLKICSL